MKAFVKNDSNAMHVFCLQTASIVYRTLSNKNLTLRTNPSQNQGYITYNDNSMSPTGSIYNVLDGE